MRSARSLPRPTPPSPVPPLFAVNMERIPESAGLARRLVIEALDAWHLQQLADAAALVLSELVSNAVNHASGDGMRVSVSRINDRRVRLAVIDRDRKRPQVRAPGPDAEGGRGLLLVSLTSADWDVDLLPGGKRVWADIEVNAS